MREMQWALDDAAYRMPRGEVTDDELGNLADQLVSLARMLRPDEQPKTIDGDVIQAVEP